jgi:glycolate oxidase FAD binding subunit
MLVRGAVELRREIDVFHPQPAGLVALSERVRLSFDPRRILNRGRLSREGA